MLDILIADDPIQHFDVDTGQRLLEANIELSRIRVDRVGDTVGSGRRGA